MSIQKSTPIACELSIEEQRRCCDKFKTGLFSHVAEVQRMKNGYALRFSWAPERLRQLGEFLAVDSACCSFFDHTIEVPRGKQIIWLHLTGPEEAQEILSEEIGRLVPTRVGVTSQVVNSSKSSRWGRWSWGGLSSIGLAGIVCCAAPAFGLSLVALGAAWLVEAMFAVVLISGAGLLWLYLRRSSKQSGGCC